MPSGSRVCALRQLIGLAGAGAGRFTAPLDCIESTIRARSVEMVGGDLGQ